MIVLCLTLAYAGFGLLTAAFVLYMDWRSEGDLDSVDGDVAVAALFVWPVFWIAIAAESLKERISRLEDPE